MKQNTILSSVDSEILLKAQGSILGAAVGDALGWPQELPRNNINKPKDKPTPSFQFQTWKRRSGGRYKPHLEVISAGEYSDDTQLIVCTARALLHGDKCWEYLTTTELPTWLHYERGGGRATLQAIRSWKEGCKPWENKKISQKYFNAGGNGVAMRILPHCIAGVSDQTFHRVAHDIVANGVTTHGHPRALVGALAYGFALWKALRERKPLKYGKLIELLVGDESWLTLPDISSIFPTWRLAADTAVEGNYEDQWSSVTSEMWSLLEESLKSTDKGALSTSTELLSQIGCFSREKGSGTITACGAIFLASRYAAEPRIGLIEAGFAYGADTDTLASMTGALLGAIVGTEWLGQLEQEVQDAKYLKAVCRTLLTKTREYEHYTPDESHPLDVVESLKKSKKDDIIDLPGFKSVSVLDTYLNESLSKATRAQSWKVRTADDQTIYFKKIWYEKGAEKPQLLSKSSELKEDARSNRKQTQFSQKAELLKVNPVETSVKLMVDDIDKSKFFYERGLGLVCSKHSKDLYKYGNIWLSEKPSQKKQTNQDDKPKLSQMTNTKDVVPDVWIQVDSLDAAYQNVKKIGLLIVREISYREESRYFVCHDPSGYLVLVNETSHTK